MGDKETTKQRMIQVTKQLICEGKRPSEITVADITMKANVGNGMVNYHFQSKDNLMREVVRDVTVCANRLLSEKLKPYEEASSQQRLAVILKEVLDFIFQNAEISRIGILDCLEKEEGAPHLLNEVTVYQDCLSELFRDQRQLWMKNSQIISFLDYVFLKAKLIKKETGLDLYNKADRDSVVEDFIRELCGN